MLDAPDLRLTHAKPSGSGALRLASFCFTNGKNHFLSQFCVPMPLATVVGIMDQSIGLVFGRRSPSQMMKRNASKIAVTAIVRGLVDRAWGRADLGNQKHSVHQSAIIGASATKSCIAALGHAKRPKQALVAAVKPNNFLKISNSLAVLGMATSMDYRLVGHGGFLQKLTRQERAVGYSLGAFRFVA